MGHEADGKDSASVPVAWVLSARTGAGLAARAARLSSQVRSDPGTPETEIGARLVAGAASSGERAVVVDDTREGLLAGLDALAVGREAPNLLTGTGEAGRRVVFVFPGQGTEWPGMAVDLLRSEPVFAERVRACERALAPYVDWSLEEVLTGCDSAPPLDRVDVVQPVLFATMVSLAALWRSFGIEPAAVVGHSQGEIAAAHVAGALSLEDAARLVALRSRALDAIRGDGAMVTVMGSGGQVREMLSGQEGRLWVAAVNGPGALTVSGGLEALTGFESALSAARILRWRLPGVDFAAHSGQVEAIRDEVLRLSKETRPCDTAVGFYSSVTAGRIDPAELGGDYWYRNLRETVRFHETVTALLADGYDAFVECGPQPVLNLGLQETADQAGIPVSLLASLRRGEGGMRRFVTALADAHVHGVPVDWRRLYGKAGQGASC
ncbi:acyltransferase domain-containing protein [Streptomyces acidiscabies]|uniref:Acyltransferase domain-containing protein n=2 Tax=Streptomyces acidiscabies TaxID=42234 RepID=A0AAP6BH91_9ACTN|nr:acyltransferase domain-containing protein [Streptomyces acidiscabies]MBP5935333.1 acyltransferase domain-containing protein [Streptomyces sp. LBUM 1476]MBZ3916830.1 acyltransferase domain-containing protein [Streptomyces acidiscabies]MDX2964432.1 acyltransferase domain-containing protein [Streptomyces acidiscabies]MDX3022981.1 acyltransferase domain-containing protein [Streptomyces acidiscabies]MDX3794255.1 acyltransferase domain-containing protein [Streptomyces acidiscabies]